MKKYLLSLFGLFLVGSLSAQDFYFPHGQSLDENGLAPSAINSDIEFRRNMVGDPITFSWQILQIDTTVGAGITFGACDNVSCYFNLGAVYTMAPVSGTTNGYFHLQCFTQTGPGKIEVTVRVWDQADPNLSDTINVIWRTNNFVGIDEHELADVSIYPNPVSDRIFVDDNRIEEVSVMDITGKELMRSTLDANRSVNVADLPKAIYILELKSNSGDVATRRFVKE